MSEDRRDYLAAFTIGAIVGIGATLLLAPQSSAGKRIFYELEPAVKRVRKGSRRVRREAEDVAREIGRRGSRAFDTASSELRRAAGRRIRKARKSLRSFR